MSERYEETDIEEEQEDNEEEQEEVQPITEESIEKKVPTIPDYLLNGLKEEGIYLVEKKTEDGEDIDEQDLEDADEEDLENIKYHLKPVKWQDIVDWEKEPKEIKEEYKDQDIAFSYDNGKIFFGKMKLHQYQEYGADRTILIPGQQGCIYVDNKLQYKGMFENGKKTIGIEYKPNKDKFFRNFKGNKRYKSHNDLDLMISVVGKNLNPIQKYDIVQKYNKWLTIDSSTGEVGYNPAAASLKNIENIKISINNGYKFDFDKTHYDYVKTNGDIKKYNPTDEEKMYINVEEITKQLEKIIEQTKGSLRNIEISGISNFGFIGNNKQQELQDAIASKLRKFLYEHHINLYFCNVCNEPVTDVEDKYIDGTSHKTIGHYGKNFYKFNAENGTWLKLDKESYKKELEQNGYYKNQIDDNEETDVSDNSEILYDLDVQRDRVLQEENRKKEILNKNIQEQKDKLEQAKLETINKPETKPYNERKINFLEGCLVVLSGILMPFIGGVLMYNYLTKPDILDDKTNKIPPINNEQQKKTINSNLKVMDVEKNKDINKTLKPVINQNSNQNLETLNTFIQNSNIRK